MNSLYLLFCMSLVAGKSIPPLEWSNNDEIELFRQYLRIETVHPNTNYTPAVNFLKEQALRLELPIEILYPANEENPVVVITWRGAQSDLPSVMFNSHMDVVPVYEEYWNNPPFAAEMDENGNIFARGAQDTKAVGMQYLAAIRELKRKGVSQLKRTVHIVYVPDEEVGGMLGMGALTYDVLPAFYVERTMWDIELIVHGHSGHGSMLFENTPGEKLNYVVNKMMEFRREESRKLEESNVPLGNVTTINLTILKGGVQMNVIPAEFSATFDIRISANSDVEEVQRKVEDWCEEAGGNITVNTLFRGLKEIPTRVDESNPFWIELRKAITDAGLKVEPTILFASSDMVFMRNLNISAIGFAPMAFTEARAHDHNEYLNAVTYLKGIEVYSKIIPNLANV